MKVICIDGKPTQPFTIPLKDGNIYNVTQCPIYPDSFDVKEQPFAKDGSPISYGKRRFIPCSDIDETELVNTKELVHERS